MMMKLLNGRFAPLTLKIGFLERPLATVVDAYVTWKRQHFQSVQSCPVVAFEEALTRLEPLTTPPRRVLFLATDSQWTSYFDNGVRGSDPFPPISYLAQRIRCRGVIATCVPHSLEAETGITKGTYGAVQFELFGPDQREFLNYERSISVAYEAGKWRFDANGAIQPFEELAKYTAPSVIDRFTPEMLGRYCEALGIRLFDETFYSGPGSLVIIGDPLPAGSKEVTLAEARRQMLLA